MDNISLMLGIFLLVLFIFPIVYVLVKQHSKDSKNKNLLNKVAESNNLKLDHIENIGHTSLGLDSYAHKLVVLEFGDMEKARVIDLKAMDQIRVAKKIERAMQGDVRKERIIHLGLEFSNKNAAQATEVTFYDEDDYDSTDADIRLHEANKWDALLHKNIAV